MASQDSATCKGHADCNYAKIRREILTFRVSVTGAVCFMDLFDGSMFEWIERLKPSLSVVSGASLDAEDELSTMQIANC